MPTLDDVLVARDLDVALAFYDGLPAVTVEQMAGAWRGREVPTGHPLDGMLERIGWHGKRFDGADGAHPLVFRSAAGTLFEVNPALVPMGLLVRHPAVARIPLARTLFRLLRPALSTTRPKARLRMTEFRGVVTATMCYDALPVHDAFRRVDDDTVLGVMELRGSDRPYVFLLER